MPLAMRVSSDRSRGHVLRHQIWHALKLPHLIKLMADLDINIVDSA